MTEKEETELPEQLGESAQEWVAIFKNINKTLVEKLNDLKNATGEIIFFHDEISGLHVEMKSSKLNINLLSKLALKNLEILRSQRKSGTRPSYLG